MARRIIVVGCGRLGSDLAFQLWRRDAEVTVLARDRFEWERLDKDFRGHLVEGDFLAEDTLHRAGIAEADALGAVTASDAVNAVLGHVARTVYRVPHVAVRNYEAEWRPMMEAFGLQMVSPVQWGAQRLAELLDPQPLRGVFCAGSGEVQVYELVVPPACIGWPVSEVNVPGHCQVVALTRSGRAIIPPADERLESGDVLYLSATESGYQALRERLQL